VPLIIPWHGFFSIILAVYGGKYLSLKSMIIDASAILVQFDLSEIFSYLAVTNASQVGSDLDPLCATVYGK